MQNNKVSTEELERLIKEGESLVVDAGDFKKTKVTRKIKEVKSVRNFIQDHNVISGDIRVPNFLIYFHYKALYERYRNADKLKKTAFFREFNKYFKPVRTGKQRYYLLNSCFNMTEEMMERALAYDRKFQRSKNGKSKEK